MSSTQLFFFYCQFIVCKFNFNFSARSHKFGRQGQASYDDYDDDEGGYSYNPGDYATNYNYSNEDNSEEDDDEDDDEDESDDESDEEEDDDDVEEEKGGQKEGEAGKNKK